MDDPRTESDRWLGETLRHLHLDRPEQIERLLDILQARRKDDPMFGLARLLREEGVAQPDFGQAETGIDAARTPGNAGVAATPHGAAVGPAAPASPMASGPFGRFRLEARLGVGGMGEVWKAWDPDLRRLVALKVIRHQPDAGAESIARFQREARLAAKLRHPRIVGVHEVGVAQGRHYIAMDFVEGRTLAAFLDETRRAKLAGERAGMSRLRHEAGLLAEVAGAVAYAHAQGVIHRDLKPTNVLLDAQDGPWVMDFGLAKEVRTESTAAGDAGTQMTLQGDVLGTPAYMSPEQALGDPARIGPRSDVWALGAILFEVLTGRPPFWGGSPWQLIYAVSHEDAPLPRKSNPHVPEDLEAVCLKALERDLERRYARAGDFAEDLRRWLRGDPVEARRPTVAYRLRRWVVRHRAVVTSVALAGLLLAGTAGWALHSSEQRTILETKVVRELRERTAIFLDATLMLRRAGLPMKRPIEAYVPQLEAAVREAEELEPARPEPRYHLGVLCRALLRDDDALRAQEGALAQNPAFAPARYERAVLTARALASRLAELRVEALQKEGERLAHAGAFTGERSQRPEIGLRSDEELERADPAAAALRARLAGDLGSLEHAETLKPAELSCLRGLAASGSARNDRERESARTLLIDALRAEPNLDEARLGLAALEESVGRWEEAITIYSAGLESDAGFVPYWFGRGSARGVLASMRAGRGEDPDARFADAEADFSRVLALAPDAAGGWDARARLRSSRAAECETRNRDPRPLFEQAVADFDRAVELDAGAAEYRMHRGETCRKWAQALASRGADPTAMYVRGAADHDFAVGKMPQRAEAWILRGALRNDWALYRSGRGMDPTETFTGAEEDVTRALTLDPRDELAWEARAAVRTNAANWRLVHGQECAELYRKAVEDYSRAVECDPAKSSTWAMRGVASANAAMASSARGEDPTSLYTAAFADFDRAMALNPALPDPWLQKGAALLDWGSADMLRGADPEPRLTQAIASVDGALERNPGLAEARRLRGRIAVHRGEHLLRSGRDPTATLAEATADLDRAIGLNAADADAWMFRAQARRTLGEWAQMQGRDAGAEYAQAAADIGKAIDTNPGAARFRWARAELRRAWAELLAQAAQDPSPLLELALADYAQALERNPNDALTWVGHGIASRDLADYRVVQGQAPGTLYAEAERDLDHAVELDLRSAEARLERGMTRMKRAQSDPATRENPAAALTAAIDDFSAAIERNPKSAPAWMNRGGAQANLAEIARSRGEDPREDYRRSVADLAHALELVPNWAVVWMQRGMLGLNSGNFLYDRGEDPGAAYREGEAALGKALELNPALVQAWIARGLLRTNWACWQTSRGGDGLSVAESAFRDFDRAIALVPGAAEPLWRRGWGYHRVGHEKEAIRDFAEASRLNPAARESCAPFWIEADVRLAERLAQDGGAEKLDAAFLRLREAVELGLRDRAALEKNGGFEPLHGDRRWPELLDAMR